MPMRGGVLLPSSLMKSKNGCIKGGPMRPCIRATALRSTQRKNHAAGTAKSKPGKMSRRAKAVCNSRNRFMPAPLHFSFPLWPRMSKRHCIPARPKA